MAIYSPNLRPEADTGRKSRYSGRNYRLTDIYIYIYKYTIKLCDLNYMLYLFKYMLYYL